MRLPDGTGPRGDPELQEHRGRRERERAAHTTAIATTGRDLIDRDEGPTGCDRTGSGIVAVGRPALVVGSLALVSDEQRSLAISQVVVPGVALVIAGPVFAARFSGNGLYVVLGVLAGIVGVGLLVYADLRYRRRRS